MKKLIFKGYNMVGYREHNFILYKVSKHLLRAREMFFNKTRDL